MADTKASAETSAGALDGTEIVRLSRGTGSPPSYSNVRTTTQAIANLGGGGGSLTLISTLTASGSAALEWTGLTGDDYLMIVRALQPATNTVDIFLQFGTGGTPTWITSSTYHSVERYWVESAGINGLDNFASLAGIKIANVVDNSGGGILGSEIKMFGLSQSIRHTVNFTTMRLNGGVVAQLVGGGTAAGTTAKTAVRLIASSGNLASGSASLYRIVP